MLFDLTGKRAIVTGATRGIGLAIATQMARAGAHVVVSSNEPDACAAVAAKLNEDGLQAIGQPCDVAVDQDLEALVGAARDRWGGVDILVCNAGVNPHHGPAAETSDAAYDRIMQVNLRSAFKLSNLVAPLMAAQRDGAIIVISSLSGLRGNRAIGAYGMSKAASAQLARNLAVEWGPFNVRANAISPGLIETDFAAPILASEPHLAKRLLQTPLRRVGSPQEIAGCAIFLASAAGAFVTGHNLVCDGGTLIAD